jgi:hypothetical protein
MSQIEKSKKREKSNSAEIAGRHRQVQSASFTKGSLQQPQQAAQPVIDHNQPQGIKYANIF